MELLANWGCPDAIGLAGIQFLGPKFEPIADHLAMECVVRCEPPSGDDERPNGGSELANLLNGANLTCKADQMWLRPQWNAQGPAPMLSFAFAQEICICGVSVWNYNGSPELSYAGVRCARFYANGKPLAIGMVLLRKAPGFVFFDFVQDVLFDRCPLIRPLSSRPQTRSIAAFIFQIRLLSSWGDEFYIGLNGLELYNRQDMPIRLRPQNLAAFPESVNCLAGVSGDPRSSDKLIDGVNDTAKAHNMWLTPILPNSCARVFIIFDAPTFVTRIRIFNYRKTPGRGVRHIALSADDLLLCSGAEVPMSSAEKTGILDVSLRDGD
uniref:KATNIP domain-containing protein n=1 Tax=Globodera rostochiensis TaxID=31243 RepID=A0A914I8Z4_GLORO